MIFISHSTSDDKFVNKLAEDLHIRGIQTWVDHHDMPAGSRWVSQLETALMQSELMLLVLSKAAMNSSYVESEWHTFFNMGRKIVPLLLDDCELPLFLRTFHQIDFRPHQNFQNQITALLQVIPEMTDATIPSRAQLVPKSIQDSIALSEEDILLMAQAVLENRALTFCEGMFQIILPMDELILQYPLVKNITIGRNQRNKAVNVDVDLSPYCNSSLVSRSHATLYYEGKCLYIQDNHSSNGTYLNGVKLAPLEYYPLENYSLVYLSHRFPLMIRYQL